VKRNGTQAVAQGRVRRLRLPPLDYWLLGAAIGLLTLGFVMVASASLPIADKQFGQPFHYVIRHGVAIVLGLSAAALAFAAPLSWWEKHGTALYFFGVLLLLLVLVPGLGRTVNGATRWIPVGPFSLQSSEFVKLFAVVYTAGYLVRRSAEVSTRLSGFIKPLLLISIASGLIMIQPDFGTTAVLLATVLGLLFLGGVPVWQFAVLLGLVASLLVGLVLLEPYRLERVTSFVRPFADPYGAGYQLSQALIAFGRGEWFGVGLGNGIQKQFFLPEAHTDFLMAVVGEELGLAGTLLVVALFAFLTWRAFHIGALAETLKQRFAAYVAYGIGLGLGLQAFINIGVNVGLLPTKGLTLPLMSYGGNSLILACVVVAILLRVDFDNRRLASGDAARESERWDRS
jgi:cell division protein FtsW